MIQALLTVITSTTHLTSSYPTLKLVGRRSGEKGGAGYEPGTCFIVAVFKTRFVPPVQEVPDSG